MQGTWVSANVNLVNSGPTISRDRRGDLNLNYTLLPSPSQRLYLEPRNDSLLYRKDPFIPTLPKISKLELNFPKMEPIKIPKMEPINFPKTETFKIPEIKPLIIPKIEPLITPKMDFDCLKPKTKKYSWEL